ncbi:MAG: hypothetical protein ACI9TK_000860 [Flavobacteriaceae bacterium]|jgi:hypothetical protein|tara:strand:+ start:1315 stop:2106 length:792 start_codon:yes stop_codon:yes gene_type:complete
MFEGTLKKMRTEKASPINYFLEMEEDFLHINQCLGKILKIHHKGSQCLNCHQSLPVFRQGFCKSCFFDSPATGDWIMRPELSKAHLDIEDRDLNYEKKIQLQTHIVYLAFSSHLKVGVTRKNQLPTRWIDQGAHEAMVLLELPNRYLAGVAEVALKTHFSDKTNWRKMLQHQAEPINWESQRNKALEILPDELKPYLAKEVYVESFAFPVVQYPEKVNSLNLIKTPFFEGKITGVKGQYLLFEDQTVFNVRSNEGQRVNLTIS